MKKSRMILIAVLVLIMAVALCACNHEHEYSTVVDKEATCTEPGHTHGVCTRCSAIGDEKDIPPLGHTFAKDENGDDIWTFDSSQHWHECTRCGDKLDPAGHDFNNDHECRICGYATFEFAKVGDAYEVTAYNGSAAEISIPATYKNKPVVGIAQQTFYQNGTITTVTLPASIKSIGRDAFANATKLETVKAASLSAWLGITFENYAANPMHLAKTIFFGVTAFGGVLDIPSGVTAINDYAFYGFGNITEITLHAVTSIGYRAFTGAFKQGVETEVNADSLAAWCGISFAESKSDAEGLDANPLSLGATLKVGGGTVVEGRLNLTSITKVGAYAFYGYDKITDIECDARQIGQYAFANCAKLKTATLSGASEIPAGLFKDCPLLDSVTLTGATYLGASAFENCKALANIELPETLTTIGEKAFEGCEKLETVSGTEGLMRVGASAFYGTKLLSGETFAAVYVGKVLVGVKGKASSNEGELDVTEGTIAIADGALSNVANLKSVKLPSTMEYIGKNALKYSGIVTSALESVDLGGTKEIAEGAFAGNAKLAAIQLPASLEKIGKNAFADCTGLKKVFVQDINEMLGIEFENANANPLTLSKALYIGEEINDDAKSETIITVPDGATEIGAYTFSGLTGVTSVVLPTSLTKIEGDAFVGCSALRYVYYKGESKDQYDSIEIADNAYGGRNVTVYYFSESAPASSPKDFWHFDGGKPTRWN